MRANRILLLAVPVVSMLAQQTVDVVQVVSKPVERKVRLPGEITPYLKVDLRARVPGFVEQVQVDRGSVVRAGQLLVALSAPELTAQRAAAEAKVPAIEAQRAEAAARLAAAESTYQRLVTAAATPGAVAENEVVLARQAVEAARAAITALENSRKAAEDEARSVRELESFLNVTAPFDGVVTVRYVHPGALVGPAAGPLVSLEQLARLRLTVAVPEAEAGGLEPGARVPFTVPAFPGQVFSGIVARNPHSLDPRTRTLPVELDVENPDNRLAPGMYPEVTWPVRRTSPSLLVPPASIVMTTERSFVIRVSDGRAVYVDVGRGSVVGDLVEVFGALKPGDEILRRATDEIREGVTLNPRRSTR